MKWAPDAVKNFLNLSLLFFNAYQIEKCSVQW